MPSRLFYRLSILPFAALSLCVMNSRGSASLEASRQALSVPPLAAPLPDHPSRGEAEVASVISAFYDSCIRDYVIDGTRMRLRIPFGQNGERENETGFSQEVWGGGKADPEAIWERIDSCLGSDDFRSYLDILGIPGPKLLLFDLEGGLWSADFSPESLEAFAVAPYPGSPTFVAVLRSGSGPEAGDIYNYLYCVGGVGLDCAGFVFNAEESLARAFGASLREALARDLTIPPGKAALFSGLWLFDPANGWTEEVRPSPESLRPGDILLFRGHLGEYKHSAILRSIDRGSGVIRYAQCTDWAPQAERGVHESFILFDPERPDLPLGDPSVLWTQALGPSFEGETEGPSWRDDGGRFRMEWAAGPSLAVRLKILKTAIGGAIPGYYSGPIPPRKREP